MNIIDGHTHLFFDQAKEERSSFFDDTAFRLLYNNSKSKISVKTDIFKYLDHNHIQKCITYGFCWQDSARCVLHNDFLSSIDDDRIIPFATIPSIPVQGIEQFLDGIALDIFKGIGEIAFYTSPFNDEVFEYLKKVFTFAQRNSLIISLHLNEQVGHYYPGKYYTPFDRLYALIEMFPDLKIILAHWGGGFLFYELMPEVKKTCAHVYYDTAASPYLYTDEIFTVAKNLCGIQKIIFGTDFPLLGASRYVEAIHNADLLDREKQAILCNNVQRLLD